MTQGAVLCSRPGDDGPRPEEMKAGLLTRSCEDRGQDSAGVFVVWIVFFLWLV